MSNPTASPLPRLPRLTSGTSCWQLPLTDHAALELARLLVVDDLARRAAMIADLMAVDPCVALWSACQWSHGALPAAALHADSGPRCVMDLAEWFAREANRVLVWSDGELAEADSAGQRRSQWRELAADSVAVAILASEPCEDDDLAAQAFLIGLLHNAPEWLGSCGPRVAPSRPRQGCLPSWLSARLRDMSRTRPSEVAVQVNRASKVWSDSGRRQRKVAGRDVSDALWARRRWQALGLATVSTDGLLPGLTEKLRRLRQLERDYQRTLEQEKLASLGELAYGASHEINNPLANISTRAQTLLTDESDPERRRTLAIINTQAFRANEMIADMMLFARPPSLVCEPTDLVRLVDEVLHEVADEAELQGTRMMRSGSLESLLAAVDATQLAMALRAIVVNALQALGAGGEIEVAVDRHQGEREDVAHCAQIRVRDTGPGIPAEVRRHLFDPYFSGREAGRGLGLGLAKCWRVVTLHGGRVDVNSQVGQGTRFTISLPLEQPEVEPSATSQEATQPTDSPDVARR